MAKVKINWPPMSMKAEGEDAAVLAQAEQFLKYVKEAHKISFDVLPTIFRDGCRDPEEGVGEPECVGCNDDCESCETYEKANSVKPLTEPEEVAPGAQWDVVAIYDNAGIPSIMHRFRRMNDKDLFHGGKDKPHPAFIIGGEVYDEIYISVYENTMINGKPYSLPYMEPVASITADKFADACFAKGEGWHCMTAAEWGLLACLSWKNGTLPHGNTNCGKYHADPTECGVNVKDSNKTLTGSGPATWTHDHTPTGVHDLCGNVLEIVRGLRIKDGALWAAENNDAALPETDLTTCGDGWKPIVDSNGDQVYVDAMDGIKFTNEKPQHGREPTSRVGKMCGWNVGATSLWNWACLLARKKRTAPWMQRKVNTFRFGAATGTVAATLACSTWTSTIRAAIPTGASGAVPLISRNAESCSLESCEPSGSEAERKK